MADKFLKLSTDGTRFEEALGNSSSAGSADAGKLVALDGNGRIDASQMPSGVVANVKTVTASEALTAGDFVNLYNNSGTLNCRKADASQASGGRKAHGYVKASVSNGASATVYFDDENAQVSGLTVGAAVFLSDTTPGQATSTRPTTSGHLVQVLGFATSATVMDVEISEGVVLV